MLTSPQSSVSLASHLIKKTGNAGNQAQEGTIELINRARPPKQWRVRYCGTSWFADSAEPDNFQPGEIVSIQGWLSATTLLIQRR